MTLSPEMIERAAEAIAADRATSGIMIRTDEQVARAALEAAISEAAEAEREAHWDEIFEVVEELPPEWEKWRLGHIDVMRETILPSLLYDLNCLPEVVETLKSLRLMRMCILITEHFEQVLRARIAKGEGNG